MIDDQRTPKPSAAAAAPEFDCQACGACCRTFDVWLMDTDLDRFERAPHLLSLTVIAPGTAAGQWRFMRREQSTGQCTALEGGLRSCRCTIYEDRPTLCRDFQAGSEDCLDARRRHGIDAA
jgi:Fe-S-cluster containining protein